MPSVRVKRDRGRPYLHIEDSPPLPPLAPLQPPAITTSTPSPVDVRHPVEPPHPTPQTRAVPGRSRSRTLGSLFGSTNLTEPQAGRADTAGRQSLGSLPGRDTNPYTCDPKIPKSRVHQHCVGSKTLRSRESKLLADRPRSASPADRRSRTSMLSVGGDGVPVDMLMDRENASGRVGSALSMTDQTATGDYGEHHHDDIVEHLDVIDPRIAAVTHLSNAANSIIFPPLSIYNRRPTISLPYVQENSDAEKAPNYQDELDRHVDHVLRKRDKIKRGLKGLWAYVKTPLGFCTALYGFLCAFWGAAIVIFLAKIINLHNPDLQNFWVEVSSQATNGLFTATGIGLIPWRVIDTYRILKIWNFRRLTAKLRAQQNLPPLQDEDDLPDPLYDEDYVHVLTDEQEDELYYQQQKFAQSQTWYRPHATETHRAFPINTALLICLLIDGNSIFQIMLCGIMWGLNRFKRPAWGTGCLIPASFFCAIGAAVFIWRGGMQSKKTKEVEDRLRKALQLEDEGLMNAHFENVDGFAVVEINKKPPAGAETMVIPQAKSPTEPSEQPDLKAVPSGPVAIGNSMTPTTSRKAPVMP